MHFNYDFCQLIHKYLPSPKDNVKLTSSSGLHFIPNKYSIRSVDVSQSSKLKSELLQRHFTTV